MTLVSTYKQRTIKKLENDISKIESYYFSYVENLRGDLDAKIYSLQTKKNLLVRSLIFEIHLAIEDFLDTLLKTAIVKVSRRTKKKGSRDLNRYFHQLFVEADGFFSGNYSVGFKRKIILLRMMGIIGKSLYSDLEILNSLRNKCGHSWILYEVKRRYVKRDKPKKYILEFNGRNLFDTDVLIHFLKTYNNVFLRVAYKS